MPPADREERGGQREARPDRRLKVLNEALSQAQRAREAPAPDQVQVDGRGLAELLAFAPAYGKHVNFYDLSNKVAGNWESFFAADPAVAAASHAALGLDGIARDLRDGLERLREADGGDESREAGRAMLVAIARLIGILDRMHLGEADPAHALRRAALQPRSDRLAAPLERLGKLLGEGMLDGSLDPQALEAVRHWDISADEEIEDLVEQLVTELKERCSEAGADMKVALAGADHRPQAALYNAFVQLFIQARETLNGFPDRLVDFYYNDILRETQFAATPDRVFLTFTRADGVDQASVPRGTRFPAGTDADGQPIEYAATTSLEVTPATIDEISVHRVAKAPGGLDRKAEPTSVLRATLDLAPGGSARLDSVPMFGSDEVQGEGDAEGALRMEKSSLGFCIAGPVLMLRGGERCVRIGFVMSAPYQSMLAAIRGAGSGEPDEASRIVDEMVAAFTSRLSLYYSTAAGWVAVRGPQVAPGLGRNMEAAGGFTVSFQLPPDAPPLVALSEQAPTGAPAPDKPADAFAWQPPHPALMLNLASEKEKEDRAGHLLAAMRFEEITIDVEVAGFVGITVTTPNGIADTRQNFAMFGLPPARNAALQLSAPELFVKRLDSIAVSIDWAALPVTSAGFRGYYDGYRIDADGCLSPVPLFDNRSFRVRFAVVNPGFWSVDEAQRAFLFRTDASDAPVPDAPLAQSSTLNVAIAASNRTLDYYDPSKSAFAIVLDSPAYAFGQELYAANLVAASHAQSAAAGQAAVGSSRRPRSPPPPPPAPAAMSDDPIATVAAVNATAPDHRYRADLRAAVEAATSSLAKKAQAAIAAAIGASEEPESSKSWWRQELDRAVEGASEKPSLWERMLGRDGPPKLSDSLAGWVDQHGASLGAGAQAALERARAHLGSARAIEDAHEAAAGQAPGAARIAMAAALPATNPAAPAPEAQAPSPPPPPKPAPAPAPVADMLPNPPWMPTASALSIAYSAAARVPVSAAAAAAASARATAEGTVGSPPALELWHVSPFGVFKPVAAETRRGATLVPAVAGEAALYIQLSAPVSRVSILFILSLADQGWCEAAPAVKWQEHIDGEWKPLRPLSDTTSGLRGSGIVTLNLTVVPGRDKAPRIRALVEKDVSNAPRLEAVIANAVTAQWVPPAGASTRGEPLPAGTIKAAATKLAGISAIAQPMQSIGGSPPSTGRDFRMRMAERLRHKEYAVTGGDYARLALTVQPSLWQAAVVPAYDPAPPDADPPRPPGGLPSPGTVWVIAVGGPRTPNVADWTVPMVDTATLANIGETLAARAGPFVSIKVTNPPYVRQKVVARIDFTDNDSGVAWAKRLERELIAWLSPCPDEKLGLIRPAAYYKLHAVTDFIRSRPYVLGIRHCALEAEPHGGGWIYLTSAASHSINDAYADAHFRASGAA